MSKYSGVVIGRTLRGETIEVVSYGGAQRGKHDAFIYTVGPRGGVRSSHVYSSPEKLRREARELIDAAAQIEAYMNATDKAVTIPPTRAEEDADA